MRETNRPHWALSLAVAVMLIWTLIPIYWFGRMSLETYAELAEFPPKFFPPEPQIGAFYNIFGRDYVTDAGIKLTASGQSRQLLLGLQNSLFVSIIVTIITTLIVLPLAYVFARLDFRHKTKLLFAILLAVALPPVSTLIPFYTMYIRLGLSGTRLGLIIIDLTITVPFVAWMLIGYFRNLPPVERLARVDGFTRFGAFLKIFLPLSRNGIIVAAVISFLFAWNEYTYAQILVNGTPATTLPSAISGFLFQVPHPHHLSATLLLSLLPPLCVAFLLQRYIADMNIVDSVR